GGKTFDSDMPPFEFLSDDEIAAVIGYVRSSWGNDALNTDGMAVSAADVAGLRDEAMTPEDVHAYRQSLQ
ncbi:MAG: hypothetical protein KDJ86_06460, partial [Bauldia sp.]|uniref:c-type cytochrome n=1 Tax=Bauldia sp. TaxID=2575872 RepID=UPI001DD3C012|nr:hypothetical protein [Bauldia sp.]